LRLSNNNMKESKKTISILGSTGSIGVQTLEVIEVQGGYNVSYLSTKSNIDLLEVQAAKYNPLAVIITDEIAYQKFKKSTNFNGKIYYGSQYLEVAAADSINDIVVIALVGFSGVLPTIAALKEGKPVALANKETLVVAGNIVTQIAKDNNTPIIAIDSEHSAILQCLIGEDKGSIEKIILTASGGPFQNIPIVEFDNLTVKQALAHPNWSMGNKITIDSATLMNKGFEVIEAYWLFGVEAKNIDVLIHPQSIIHSLVQFIDGSVKAQLGVPDMRIPISYALSYPDRIENRFPRLELIEISNLTFEKPDLTKFPCLQFAFNALKEAGTMPTILNAANEIAVASFLAGEIQFTSIPRCIEKAMNKISVINNPSLTEIIDTDKETRNFSLKYIEDLRN
jgi:1-deoxy-D-xylulose-5-phosphate reductoisomerase